MKGIWVIPIVASILLLLVGTISLDEIFAATFLDKFGSEGISNGQFNGPYDLILDLANTIYVTDSFNDRIQKFNSAGVFLDKFGSECILSSGSGCVDPDGVGPLELGDGQFNRPRGMAVDSDGNIYVADTNNHRIVVFNSAFVFQDKFGTSGSGDGQFNNPRGIAVDSDGNIYVADSFNNRIQKFNSAFVFQDKFGTSGSGDGQFDSPSGIVLDSSGNIYVADNQNDRIQIFNSAGVFFDKFGSECILSSGSGCVDPDGVGPLESGDGQFNRPWGLTLDSSGNIYVADIENNRIQKFYSEVCTTPVSGSMTITSDCTLLSNDTAPANVIVQNNSILTIPSGVTFDIDFTQFNLTVQSGSGVLIESGGKII